MSTNSKRVLYPVLLVIATTVTVYFQYDYQKFDASWWGVNIYVFGIVLGGLIAWGMVWLFKMIAEYFEGFDSGKFVPRVWVYLLVTLSCFGSIYLGTTFTEPSREWTASHSEVSHNDRYHHSTFHYFYYGSDGGSVGIFSGGGGSSKSDSGGEALAYLVILLIIVIILVLSATVQHFWVVGSIAILFMMAKFTLDSWSDGGHKQIDGVIESVKSLFAKKRQ